jgi:hypothetical protein
MSRKKTWFIGQGRRHALKNGILHIKATPLWTDSFIISIKNLDYRFTSRFNLWRNFPVMNLTGDFSASEAV